ncbi:glutathione S-transferase family protein [Agrobacterium tumefaciens]|nr:glutathione S-transferase family protein [Agrobacterium tumefaciens]
MTDYPENTTHWRTVLEEATLIGFRICPFATRVQIVANLKNINLRTEYIDLVDKPAWFLKLSPTGTVPAIQVGGRFIFESVVIADLIDTLTGEALYPKEPLEKFQNKSWIEYASTVIRSQYMMIMARDLNTFEIQKGSLSKCLEKIEGAIAGTPYFNGPTISMVDAVYAPVLYRFLFLESRYGINILHKHPNIRMWAEAMTTHPSVVAIHGDDFSTQLIEHMTSNGSVLTPRE